MSQPFTKRLSTLLLAVSCVAFAEDAPTTPIGMPGRVEQIVLPGTELEAIPTTDPKAKLVLRVLATYPHGSAFRYDLEYVGLTPGEHNLNEYLRRKDGSKADLPPIMVRVSPSLPPGSLLPHSPEPANIPWLGGYRALSIALAAIWALGFLGIILWGRKRRAQQLAARRPVTLADQLRPMVESALSGTRDSEQLATLERLLLSYWRRRLQVEGLPPRSAIAALRAHPEAGELLRSLEDWLHRPGGDKRANVDELLKPYQNLPPEEVRVEVGV